MDKIATVREQVQIEEWAEIVSECQSSGLSARKWCMENGINPHTYYNLLRKVREAERLYNTVEALKEVEQKVNDD